MSRLTRFFALATAAVTLALPAGLAATAASAATGPVTPTKEEAGYQFTGAQFRYAQATVYLRNASQYSASIGGLGQSVQFWGGGNVYVLGVSDSTTASPYSPAVAVFNNSTHALVCATANNTCAGTPPSWTSGVVSYPVGDSVQEEIFYNQGNGDLAFTVNDLTAHTSSGFTLNIGTGSPSRRSGSGRSSVTPRGVRRPSPRLRPRSRWPHSAQASSPTTRAPSTGSPGTSPPHR